MDGRLHLNIDLYNIYFILKLMCAWNLDLDLHCNNLSVKWNTLEFELTFLIDMYTTHRTAFE